MLLSPIYLPSYREGDALFSAYQARLFLTAGSNSHLAGDTVLRLSTLCPLLSLLGDFYGIMVAFNPQCLSKVPVKMLSSSLVSFIKII